MSNKSIEVSGKTAVDAIIKGLDELGASMDEVEIEILREGSKGIFGLGSKDFLVRLTKKETPGTAVIEFIENLCAKMGVEAKVEAVEEEESIHINLSGPHMGVLIGHRGETLDAIQYLANLVMAISSPYTVSMAAPICCARRILPVSYTHLQGCGKKPPQSRPDRWARCGIGNHVFRALW